MLESYRKGKDQKKKKKRREKTVGEEVEKICDFVSKKKRVKYYVVGVKSEWERKHPSLQISLNII